MVLKFREEALKKVEKAQKEGRQLTPEETDNIIDSMRREINELQELNSHHPDVARLSLENNNLKQEVRRLKSESDISQEMTCILQQKLRELLAEQDSQQLDGNCRTLTALYSTHYRRVPLYTMGINLVVSSSISGWSMESGDLQAKDKRLCLSLHEVQIKIVHLFVNM